MKKEEAKVLSVQRVDLIMEYINGILSDDGIFNSKINFNHSKINGQIMSILEIRVPHNNFEKNINLGITYDHINELYKQLLDRIVSDILPSDNLGATRFYTIKGDFESFSGIEIMNINNSKINIDMPDIELEVKSDYNNNYNAFVASTKHL